MVQEIQAILRDTPPAHIVKIVLSSPQKDGGYKKIMVRPVAVREGIKFQMEKHSSHQVFHENIEAEALGERLGVLLTDFRQADVFLTEKDIHLKLSKKGKVLKSEAMAKGIRTAALNHNKEKQYILGEGRNIPALVDLGIFNSEFRVVKGKFDKYKQINRFVEIIHDEIKSFGKKEITILDFGCGKSYLTFVLYYYLREIAGINPRIIGYDLKADVVENCNGIAKKYGYEHLTFMVGDVAEVIPPEGKNIDMVISLHACDTATDYALHRAISWGAKYIFCVPCCQHELNAQIETDGPYRILLSHGLIKERFSALLTDAVRCEILKSMGYTVDVIEFVDFAHSPKNLMIRGKKTGAPRVVDDEKLKGLMAELHIKPKLYTLIR